jgi:protein SCO1
MQLNKTIILGSVLAIFFAFFIYKNNQDNNQSVEIGGKFSLTNQFNKTITENDLKGKYSVIFFGYTECTDICPTTLSSITKTANKLTKSQLENLNLVFITIDPETDTPAVLNNYMKNFHPNFMALTGSKNEILQVINQYKIYAENYDSKKKSHKHHDHSQHNDKHKNHATKNHINHSTIIYIFDKSANYESHFSNKFDIQEFTNKLKVISK